MTDIDLIANLDPATGLPLVDTRSAARRWLEALAYGSEHHDVTKAFSHEHNFGQVGAGETTPTIAAPTAAHTNITL